MLPLIAHIVHSLDYGGLENGLVNLLNGLPRDRYRHAVVCLTGYSDFHARIDAGDLPLFALDKQPGKDPRAYWRLWRLLRRLGPAIVHTRNMGVLDCTLVAQAAGVPVRIHGHHGWDVDDLHGDSQRRNRIRKLCDRFVTHYVAVSGHIAEWLITDQGIDRNRISAIFNGVDTERFAPGRPEASLPAPWQPSDNDFVIGTIGRLEAVKNQRALVLAFFKVLGRRPELANRIRLVIVGEGSRRPELEQLIAGSPAAPITSLVGWRDDISAVLSQFDLFVLPSLNEGISNTVLEAMACGTPVVATNVGGNPQLITPGETGNLVAADDVGAMADAIEGYVDSPELLARHGEAARARAVESFSLKNMLDQYDSLYLSYLKGA